MTLPDFSVLLLAWDEADPSVAVLGGAALPPTHALVYQLAAQQPVLALYPHLPAPGPAEDVAPAVLPDSVPSPAAPAAPTAPDQPGVEATATPPAPTQPDLLTSIAPTPGVRLLPGPAVATTPDLDTAATPPLSSRVIGLEDLTGPILASLGAGSSLFRAVPSIPTPVSGRSQWPAGTLLLDAGQWAAPAAPYAGAAPASGATGLAPPARSQPDSQAVSPSPVRHPPPPPAPARPAASHTPATLQPSRHPLAGDLRFDPDPELPAAQVHHPPVFDEATEEPGPAEAAALADAEGEAAGPVEAPATAAAPAVPVTVAVAEPLPAPVGPPAAPAAPGEFAPAVEVRAPVLKGLNFRMIEYARQAARLVRGRADFGVIYAPNWPAWLAALEVRNHTGQPLVLYAVGLAADFATPAERGWLLEVERMALRRAQVVLVPDEGVRQRLLAQYGATQPDVRVVAAQDEAAVHAVLREAAAQQLP